jgi:hypothetical protein
VRPRQMVICTANSKLKLDRRNRWRERAIEVSVPGHSTYVGVCPDAYDLCASKMARNEEKDRDFVGALAAAGLINRRRLRNRFDEISETRLEPARRRVASRIIRSFENHVTSPGR